MLKLPKIYPLTNTEISGLTHSEQCLRLIEGGAEFIQIREKNLASDEFYEAAKECVEIAKAANVRIIINDRVDISIAVEADGVHLGQNDLPPFEARKLLGEKKIIGFSTHNREQVIEAMKMPVDYIAIGPVFATSTKENPDEIVGIEGVLETREIIGEIPLVAIGGISAGNLKEVFKAGADSAAMVSEILKTKDITSRYKEIISEI